MKNMESGSNSTKENLFTKLEEQLDVLKNELIVSQQQLQEIQEDTPISGDDVASQRDDRERVQQEIANIEERINEAERALRWSKEHGFICAVCSKPIEADRLEADIASITCKEHRDQEDTLEV